MADSLSDFRGNWTHKDWVRVKNGTGAAIPPYSVVLISSVAKVNDEIVYTVIQPNSSSTEFNWGDYLVTGPTKMGAASTAEGIATDLTNPGYVRYDGSGTPARGQVWGPKHGQLTLSKNYYGFHILGGNTTVSGNNVTAARWIGPEVVLGKVDDTNVSLDATCTVSVWDGAGAGDTTMDITATNRLQALTAVNGRFCGVSRAAGTPVLMWCRRTVTSKTIIDDFRIKSGNAQIEAESFTGYIEEPGTASYSDKVPLTSC